MKNKIAYVALLLLSGCGTPAYVQQMDQYTKQGNCQAALRTAENSGVWYGERYYMIAGVYELCFRDRGNAIRYATLAARYDSEAARNFLAKVGASVPYADLAHSSGSSTAEAFAKGIQDLNESMKRSNSIRTNCTSYKGVGNSVDMSCSSY